MKLPRAMSMREVARRAGRDAATVWRRLRLIDQTIGSGKLLFHEPHTRGKKIMVSTAVLLREWPDVFRVTFASDSEVDELREEVGELRHAVRGIAAALGVRVFQSVSR